MWLLNKITALLHRNKPPMAPSHDDVPKPGKWPVDPQEDVPTSEGRLWVDGCFDFAHHGHAGAMLQARQLGDELLVGVHSDEAILENKGPTVMNLEERVAAVEACRWATKAIPHAPYVTSLPWITHYGSWYVVHGDDITSDSNGEDCYRFVKAAGRFKVVKRTPGISTTDLVGRMLLCTRTHFIKSLDRVLAGEEGSGGDAERKARGEEMLTRIKEYATDESGHKPHCEVWTWSKSDSRPAPPVNQDAVAAEGARAQPTRRESVTGGVFNKMVSGTAAKPGQKIVYVDGGFDLFSSGHIEFLKKVKEAEPDSYVIAGVHDDEMINAVKGVNYPIMNIFERGLCVLQCKYINAVVFRAPYTPGSAYLKTLPYGLPAVVYHGPTAFMPKLDIDPYASAKRLGIYKEIGDHPFAHVNAGEIVERILKSRARYEERQRAKGVKGIGEEAVKKREEMEAAQKRKELTRQYSEVERSYGL